MYKSRPFLNWFATTVLLMALWFVMSGKTEPKFLILGVLSSAIISLICLRTTTMRGCRTDKVYYAFAVGFPRHFIYAFWLLWQIAKSAFYVARVSIGNTSVVDPSICWFRAHYDNPAARATLANSITLTPGTITIDITDDGIYSVHALTKELRDGVLDGSMQAKVARMFGEEIDFAVVDENEVEFPPHHEKHLVAHKLYKVRRKSL